MDVPKTESTGSAKQLQCISASSNGPPRNVYWTSVRQSNDTAMQPEDYRLELFLKMARWVRPFSRWSLTLRLLNIVPDKRNMARVSMSMILFGDLKAQSMSRTRKVTNGIIGRAASIGDRILPVLYLYALNIFTITMGRLDSALACSKNSSPRPNGIPNGRLCCFQNSNVPNHVVKKSIVDPCMNENGVFSNQLRINKKKNRVFSYRRVHLPTFQNHSPMANTTLPYCTSQNEIWRNWRAPSTQYNTFESVV